MLNPDDLVSELVSPYNVLVFFKAKTLTGAILIIDMKTKVTKTEKASNVSVPTINKT